MYSQKEYENNQHFMTRRGVYERYVELEYQIIS